jgi:hypothetical protein
MEQYPHVEDLYTFKVSIFFFSKIIFAFEILKTKKEMESERKKKKLLNVLKPDAKPLEDEAKIRWVKSELIRMWNMASQKFQGFFAKPVSLERKNFSQIKDQMYTVSEKTDGAAYALVLSKWPKTDDFFAVMVDSKEPHMNMYEVSVCAPPEFFEGSLFTGELVWEKAHVSDLQTFLVYDVSFCKGQDVSQESYYKRHGVCKQSFLASSEESQISESKMWMRKASELAAKHNIVVCTGNDFGLSFRCKEVFPASRVKDVWEMRSQFKHQSDGLIFTPVHEPVRHGTQWTLFKYKHDHTLDFEFVCFCNRETSKMDWQVFFAEKGGAQGTPVQKVEMIHQPFSVGNQKFEKCHLQPSLPLLSVIKRALENPGKIFNFIGECRVHIENGNELRLILERLRHDKILPNWRFTVERTLVNIREDISVEELDLLLNKK